MASWVVYHSLVSLIREPREGDLNTTSQGPAATQGFAMGWVRVIRACRWVGSWYTTLHHCRELSKP